MKINIKNNSPFHLPLHPYFTVLLLFFFLMGKSCFGVIMVDVSEVQQPVRFTTSTYQEVSTRKFIRVFTFDTDAQQIQKIDYLLPLMDWTQYRTPLDSCVVEYGQEGLKITPTPGYKACFRSSGMIDAPNVKSLSSWDKTRETYSFICQGVCFSNHDIITLRSNLETYNLEKPTPKKKRPQWKKNHQSPMDMFYRTNNVQHKPNGSSFLIPSKTEMGEIGEIACDLTMMAAKWVKLDAKYSGNKGLDGLYQKKDILIAAEAKYWKDEPPLNTILRNHLVPKFDIQHRGSIVCLDPSLRRKIENASRKESLYLLPYGILPDGQAYCKIMDTPYKIQNLEEAAAAVVIIPPLPSQPLPENTPLTPEPALETKRVPPRQSLERFMSQTGTSLEDLKKIIAEMEQDPLKPKRLSFSEPAPLQ